MFISIKKLSLFIFCQLILISSYSQISPIDSLNKVLLGKVNDTAKVRTLLLLADQYKNDYQTTIKITNQALSLATSLKFSLGIANSCISMGSVLFDQGNFKEALKYNTQALEIFKVLNDKEHMAVAYGNIAGIYSSQGNYPESIKNYFTAMKLYDVLGKNNNMGKLNHNIGVAYMHQGNFEQALKYYEKAEALFRLAGDQLGLANVIENKGIIYCQNGDLVKGMECFKLVLNIYQSIDNKQGVSSAMNNIATVSFMNGDLKNTEDYLKNSLKIVEELDNKTGMATAYLNLGELYISIKKYEDAKLFLNKSLKVSTEIGSKDNLMLTYKQFITLDSLKGNFEKAFEDYKKFTFYSQSLINEEKTKETVRAEMNYEFDKQQALQLAEQEKKDALAREELSRQTIQRNGSIAGSLIFLLLSVVTYKSYRNKKKANVIITAQKSDVEEKKFEIEKQKHLVEEKNNEIIASITYARRLQRAILPSEKSINNALENCFILYKPKDIVAGDFYWLEKTDEYIYIAAADCTGHGVPGAMVSVVCANALNRAVKEFDLKEPGKILDKARELVIETFERSESEVKDGMDISFCALNKDTGELLWAGANNPLWIIRSTSEEIEEFKGDKQPIGKMDNMTPFNSIRLRLMQGDSFYIFTDGFADQFGGEKGKKYKSANFKKLLLSMQKEEIITQGKLIDEALETWKGGLEQVDDVCVIGVKI